MKRKIAAGIVKRRNLLMIALLLLAAASVLTIGKTNINYDLNRYLSDDTMTKRGLAVMEAEFGSSDQLRVMFADSTEEQMAEYLSALNEQQEVLLAAWDPETDTRVEGETTWQLVTVTLNDTDSAKAVEKIRGMFPEAGTYYVGGSAAGSVDVQRHVGEEMPLVMILAIVVVLIMLLVTSHAWLEPVLMLIVLAVSILINMGTNFIFSDISFITFAVCAILQLALSIDYAIMLLHTWNGYRDAGMDGEGAMREALAECFMRIASSAMTTVAGLLSLLFMSFTIGFDIGLVLSKGIVISMLCVFLLMPGLALRMEKALIRTRHRPLRMGGDHLARWISRVKKPLAAVLVLAVLFGLYMNSRIQYTFSSPQETGKGEAAQVSRVFGESNPLVLLVPGGETDADYEEQRELVRVLRDIRRADGSSAVGDIAAMVTTGEAALAEYTAEDVAELTGIPRNMVNLFFFAQGYGESVRADQLLRDAETFAPGNETVAALAAQLETARSAFIGPEYARMLVSLNFRTEDADFQDCMEEILAAGRKIYGDEYYVTGIHMSIYDISEAFRGDLLRVNLITLLAILMIVAFSFRSLLLPALLVFVIEGAIWITMGISPLFGQPIFFISYLICLSIQMGATIDYGILLSDQYRSGVRAGRTPEEAMAAAMKAALPTILTSGIILTVAGYIIGRVCSIYYIYSIGLMVSRGALVSVLLVIFLLPALLLLLGRRGMLQRGRA